MRMDSSFDLLGESEVRKYCRVCLCKKDSLRNIFDSNGFICARVQSCTGLQMAKCDNYPNGICNECLDSLITLWSFKNSCHRSEKWLKQFIQIGNIEISPKTIVDKLYELGTSQAVEIENDKARFFDNNFKQNNVEEVFINLDKDCGYNEDDDDDDRHRDDFDLSYTDLSTKEEKNESNQYHNFYTPEKISSLNEKNDAVKDETDAKSNGVTSRYNFRKTSSFPTSSDSSTFKCTECPKTFDFQGTLSYHMRLYHGIELPDETNKASLRQKLLQKKPVKKKSVSKSEPKESNSAMKITVPPLPSVDVDHKLLNEKAGYRCEVCKKAFMRRHHVIRHLKYHLLDELLTQEKLDIAIEKINKKYEAERRAMEATPGAGRWGGRKEKDSPVMCSLCNKMYPSEKKLQVHMGNVHRPHKICEVCGEPYKNSEHLRIHLPPRFACDMCDYRGVRKIDIIRHIATHGAPKEFKCDQCPAEFHIKGNLNRHYEIRHCTGLPFQCDQCERAFKVRRYLTEHINTVHRQIKKSHQCGVCMMKYVKRGSWRKHMVRVHGITPPKERLGRKRTAIVLQEHQVDLPRIGRPHYNSNPRNETHDPGWDLPTTQSRDHEDWSLLMGSSAQPEQ